MSRHTHSSKSTRAVMLTVSCFILLFFLFSFSLAPLSLHAQSFVPGGETTLTLSPQSPKAGQEFTARVEAYSYDIARARISWSIDGVIQETHAGKQTIILQAPALGVPLRLSVKVTEASGAVHTVVKTVTPSALDLIIESNTRVPRFYRGRALPSPGSTVRLIAMPSLYNAKGVLANTNSIIYTWEVAGQVVSAGAGQNTLTTTMPLGGSLEVGLTAETQDGTARHSTLQEIASAEPQMLFYEDNPLHGLAQNALPKEFTLIEDEISIRAEPYFVSPSIFNNATYAWTIAHAPVQNPNADPQTLTLRKTGGSGSSLIGFSIRNLSSLLQAASSAFTVYFE